MKGFLIFAAIGMVWVTFMVSVGETHLRPAYQSRACPPGETYVWSGDDEVAQTEIPNWKPVMCKDELPGEIK